MSSHYIYIACENCNQTEPIYTGDKVSEDFDDADWEGESISVPKCIACKATPQPKEPRA
jgi:hypothetical protein